MYTPRDVDQISMTSHIESMADESDEYEPRGSSESTALLRAEDPMGPGITKPDANRSIPIHGDDAMSHTHSNTGQGDPVRAMPVYKARWFGVAVIALLNFMSAWSIIMFAPIAGITRDRLGLSSLTPVNWLYICSAFVYVAVSPLSYLVTHRDTKAALVISAGLLILGSWLRYIGTRLVSYPYVLLGSLLCGASQPFALNIPSHFSDFAFPANNRVTPTALMSLANPLGQAIGTLVVPLLADEPETVPTMALYVAVLFTATVWTVFLVPARQDSVGNANQGSHNREDDNNNNNNDDNVHTKSFISSLLRNKDFYYLFVPFAIYVAGFNAFASLTQQFIEPYGFSDIQAGIVGAATVIVGLLAGGISAPIFDRTGAYKLPIRLCVVTSSLGYLGLVFVIREYSVKVFACLIALAAMIGAASLVLLPIVLELASDITHPIPPELGSSVLWAGGQGLGGIFILIMDKMRTSDHKYTHSLTFLVIVTAVPLPFALALTASEKVRHCRQNKRLQS